MPRTAASGRALSAGDRAVRFLGNLTLTDDFSGQPFKLRAWQEKRIIRPIFGTLLPDGRRRYRRVFLFLPRKQAKTQTAAGIGVYGLHGTGKDGEEITCAASDRAQASHLFRKAADMIEADPFLSRRTRIYHSSKKIEARKSGNVLQVVSSDAHRQHGGNPSIILLDELHTQKNRRLFDVLTSSQGARTEPLIVMITTAGNDRRSLCYEEYEYAKRVEADPSLNPSYLPIIFEAGKDDDWREESTWRKAMPALGDFCQLDFIQNEFLKAQSSAAEESKFRQFFLNQWVASTTKWLRREAWDRCGEFDHDPDDLIGRTCFGGLDLSNTSDLTAFVLAFPMDDGSYRLVCRFWVPEGYAAECDVRRNTSYLQWAKMELITLTPGGVIDHELIWKEILGDPDEGIPGLRDIYNIANTRLDPHSAAQTGGKLRDGGMDVEAMRQGTISMNEPTAWLDVLIAKGLMHHGNNPVLNWQADNAAVEKDGHGNIKISKEHSADKVDGMVALTMALAAAMFHMPTPAPTCLLLD